MQGAQLHSAAQPGFQQQHPQQQMDPRMHPHMLQMMQEQASQQAIAPPEQAIKNIQDQIKSFYNHYPNYVNSSPQGASPNLEMPSPMIQATTPVLMQRAGTPPNGFLPSPPPTQKTSGRYVRHLDAAPMPVNLANVPMVHIQQPATHDMPLFEQSFGSEYSSYQSSMADPMSPHLSLERQASMRAMSMPTLFEDGSMVASPEMMAHHHMMMAAQEGRFFYPDSPMRIPMSPREAMLASLEVDASIEDTGISAEEVAQYISQQDPGDSKWTCLFPECGKKFGRKENIRSHVQTHLGDRQFKCNHCGKCFVRQHDLKRHAKIHSGDKPHKCPCGNGFARQDALTRHRQRGVCTGALPGFERREVKRGRPRKNRPELADRAEKASKARRMDARRGSEDVDAGAYSSSSSPSESGASNPYTPPHLADTYDDEQFSLSTAEGVEAFIKAYQDTPPTSPATGGSPTSASRPGSFEHSRLNFDLAAASSAGSPSDAGSPHPVLDNTASFDFAAPTHQPAGSVSPTAVSPKQLHSAHGSPMLSNLHHTPALSATHTTSSNVSRPSSSQYMSQPEPTPSSFADGVFDWGTIDAQPSLVTDPFSPAAASSPTATDLWGEDDLFSVDKMEMFGGKVGVVGMDQAGSMEDRMMEWDEGISWLN
ncbi:C2H2 type zinc finger domain-containing protein 1 [Elsinoe australis]|uniref:C2H2 type zinc finger domain-containing protein 1 n=1 Tax=Elsinoe australis TaxID=40998 RepID=A0A4U7BFR5_9PEZI|nr:C2H2 type zinc finger domain-containing protein 1 [Elsinoe australis]